MVMTLSVTKSKTKAAIQDRGFEWNL